MSRKLEKVKILKVFAENLWSFRNVSRVGKLNGSTTIALHTRMVFVFVHLCFEVFRGVCSFVLGKDLKMPRENR